MSVRRRLLNPIKERNRWLVTRLLMLAGVLAGVGLAEISLRVARISYPELWLPDDCTGWTHRPNAEGWWRREGFALVRINSDGLRDREHSKTKPGQTLRIAVLGDSFAEALQIPVDKTFWAVLERELAHSKALDGYKIEVINFGVGGYGTAQELLALRSRVWAYSPDIVLLAFYNGNDLSDNSPAFCASDQPRPFFSYQGSALKLDVSFRKRPDYRLLKSWPSKLSHEILDRSRLLQVIARAKGSLVEWLWGPQPEEINSPHAAVWELLDTLDTHIFSPPTDPTWSEAWRVTEDLLRMMHSEVSQHNAQFVVVTLSNPAQVYPDAWARSEFMRRLGLKDLFYPDSRIKALGKREGFLVVNLAESLQTFADSHHAFLHGFANSRNLGFSHWNIEGHEVAGEIIAEQICQNLLANLPLLHQP